MGSIDISLPGLTALRLPPHHTYAHTHTHLPHVSRVDFPSRHQPLPALPPSARV